jgi:hypothetical protein
VEQIFLAKMVLHALPKKKWNLHHQRWVWLVGIRSWGIGEAVVADKEGLGEAIGDDEMSRER